MTRLTKRYPKKVTIDASGFIENQETIDRELRNFVPAMTAVEKLAEYEDAEEKGLLAHLPCKVGDVVYEICERKRQGKWRKVIIPREIHRIEICSYNAMFFRCGTTIAVFASQLGETVDKIVNMRRKGIKIRIIVEEVGVSQAHVYRILHDRLSEEEMQEAKEIEKSKKK